MRTRSFLSVSRCVFDLTQIKKSIALHQKMTRLALPNETGWWFQTFFMFHFIYGMSSFPLTNSIIFQVGQPPTRRTGKHSSNQPQKKISTTWWLLSSMSSFWARWLLRPGAHIFLQRFVGVRPWVKVDQETNGNQWKPINLSRIF